MKTGPKILCVLIGCLFLSACATSPASYRTNPQLIENLKTTKKITIIPLKIEVCELSAGGIKEKIDEWCVQAKNNVMTAIQKQLETKPILIVKPFHETVLSEDQRANLAETRALFDAVNASILTHTYGIPEQRFPEKIVNFDYSLGEEVGELSAEVDVLLFVRCIDIIPTAGKQALETGKLILGALAGVALPVNMGGTLVSIALVDADTGLIIWYNQHGSGYSADLRDPIKTTTIVKKLLDDLPI
ncbi:MAG: hypothetical protein PVF78_05895 [Desulfobacterales bacterium]|jgi:hypothetical protein